MAFNNKVILNAKTGQSYRFIQTAKETNGRLLEIESAYNAQSKEPPLHYHPYQEEDFIVVSGELTVNLNGGKRTLKKGDTLHIPKNTPHSMWNSSDRPAVINWKTQPALRSEQLFEIVTGLANNGKTRDNGTPDILQASLLMTRFSREFRLAKPPYAIQRIVFLLIRPIAILLGYKAIHPEYLD